MAKLYGEIAAKALLTLDKSFARANGQPLDASEVYYSLEDAKAYAVKAQAYVGQKIVVIENGVVSHYSIDDVNGTLKELGSKPIGDGTTISIAEDGTISLANISDAEATGTYNAVLVNGKLTWVKPSETTVEGLSDLISALTKRVETVEGDYLVEADKEELATAIATEKARAEGIEASLQTQINTILNNPETDKVIDSIAEFTQYIEEHGTIAEGFRTDIDANADAIEALETDVATLKEIDHSLYATNTGVNSIKESLEATIATKAASSAVTANTEAIAALQGEDTAIKNRLDALEGEKASYATKDELKAIDDKVIENAGNITALGTRIDGVSEAANQGIADAAAAQNTANAANSTAAENKQSIEAIDGVLTQLRTSINNNAQDISGLSTTIATNKGQVDALEIAVNAKAEQSTVSALQTTVAEHGGAIAALEAENTAIKNTLDTKANASNVYTKTEIGTIEEGKTIVGMIAEAKAEATYDDSAIRALITEEVERAKAAEKNNSDTIKGLSDLVASITDNETEDLDSIVDLINWVNDHDDVVTGLTADITANAAAIKELSDSLPGAIANAMLKADDVTIIADENGVISVKEITTDMIKQGKLTLILNGGSANE